MIRFGQTANSRSFAAIAHSRAGVRRGFTLIELLVGMAVGGAILGLLFEIFMYANRETDQQILDARAVMEATSIAKKVEGVLLKYHPPVARGENTAPKQALVFEHGRIDIYSSANPSGAAISRFSIRTEAGSDQASYVAIAQQTAETTGEPELLPAGSSPDQFSSTIEFQYADQFDAGLSPQLTTEHSGGAAPAYVRFRIEVKSKKNPAYRPVVLNSGVALQ